MGMPKYIYLFIALVVILFTKLVLGQTHNKELYGQFYGRGVVVHQYSKVYRVPFTPKKTTTSSTLLDVAWFGVLK
jgi:hypothetical protein